MSALGVASLVVTLVMIRLATLVAPSCLNVGNEYGSMRCLPAGKFIPFSEKEPHYGPIMCPHSAFALP